MSKFGLQVNSLTVFDSVEDARIAGQAVELILGDGSGVTIRQLKGLPLTHPLHPDVVDRSKFVRRSQETQGRAQAIATMLVKSSAASEVELPEGFTAGYVTVVDGDATVDFKAFLASLVEAGFPQVEAKELLSDAAGKVAANEASRVFNGR